MNTFNKILPRLRSSVPSGTLLTNSRVGKLVCAALLAGLSLCGSANAYNVLVNPGAETTDLTGWQQSLTGYKYVVSTNGTIPNSGGSNFLAHSGANTFQLFDTTSDMAIIYQDFAAISNSQWSASCYAICYASNYFSSGTAYAFMQVAFYDASNNIILYPAAPVGGVYGSDLMNAQDLAGFLGLTYTVVPPPAVDASGWLFLQATNLFTTDPANVSSFYDTPIATTLTAPPGTAYVRYQLIFDNTGSSDGGDVYWDDCVLNKLNQTDPDITNAPVAVNTYAGLPASFSVVAVHTGAYPGEKLSYQWEYNGTPLPPGGGVNDISGTTTTSTLNFSNLKAADSGLYDVVVTVKSTAGNYTNSIRSVPVPLNVLALSPLQKANVLGPNAGFENNPVWTPWEFFNGCYFATAANFFDAGGTIPVNVFDGNSVAQIGANGDRDNGFHHAFGTGVGASTVAGVTPGSIWKAGGWAYISSLNDFISGNTCRLQIWFKDVNGNDLTPTGVPTFESFKIYGTGYNSADAQYTNVDLSSPNYGQVGNHAQLPRDQWCYLAVTNVVNNAGIGLADDLPIGTWNGGYFIVPTNSAIAQINFQVYEYCPVAADNPQPDLTGIASDCVYWDDMQLIQVLPATNFTAKVSGNNINLSFAGEAGLNFTVLYKTNLSDANWSVLTNNVIAPMSWQTNVNYSLLPSNNVGTFYYPITVSDSVNAQSRFYRVQAH